MRKIWLGREIVGAGLSALGRGRGGGVEGTRLPLK